MEPHDYPSSSSSAAYGQQNSGGLPPGQYPPPFPQQQQHPSFLPPPPPPHHLQHPHPQFPHPLHPQNPQFPPFPRQPQQHLPTHFPQFPHQQQPPSLPLLPPHHLPPPQHFPQPHPQNPFFSPFESPPPPTLPPPDPELHKRIEKLVEYAAKNGPEFEAMIRDKQSDNPEYAFLFGGEGGGYYRYKLFLTTHNFPLPMGGPMPPMAMPLHFGGGGFYDQQQFGGGRGDMMRPFKGLAGPLPGDVAGELVSVLNNLTGTKESIKGAKTWFMQRSPFAPALAEALKDRVLALEDSERQLHIVYLANDILFDSLQRRADPREVDNEALAFRPVLGTMLASIYHNPHNKEANQARLQKILQFWASKEVFDPETIYTLEGDMIGGPPLSSIKDLASIPLDPSGLRQGHALNQWQPDPQRDSLPPTDENDKIAVMNSSFPSGASASQFLSSASPFPTNASSIYPNPSGIPAPFSGSLPPVPPVINQAAILPSPAAKLGDQAPPPYPLFPPGLIPGMVRKMQIGSGVPYSPMSPLDIPTVIPPSNVSQSYVLDRVNKFFKDIGEVNPSEGPMKSSKASEESDDDEEYERELPNRMGGACIPPPPNLSQVDLETGTLPDGSVERKPGSSSSGRLGLGATANPNEITQYDDVYSSYRKQRSTNYHTSMSARAAAR